MLARDAIDAVLARRDPGRFVYAPNYWQWFSHHRNHGTLPAPLQQCKDQLEMFRYMGLDVFSRNIYCDQRRCWFGGLAEERYDEGVECETIEREENFDLIIERTWQTPKGPLSERLRHVFSETTLVQEKFVVDDYESQIEALECLVEARRWRFDAALWTAWRERVGEFGYPVAGELYSPLKLLHLVMGPQETTFFLVDEPERAQALLTMHEEAQLDLVRQMAAAGVPAMMAMDNLDSVFHTPAYVEAYSASFYTRAAALCHEYGSTFFIHACGRQKENLERIASYGVDGLEGVAYPPLGNVELIEALERTGSRFIVTGGISAIETDRLDSPQAVHDYLQPLLEQLRPYRHRFILSSSCNTAITAEWRCLEAFLDAWRSTLESD